MWRFKWSACPVYRGCAARRRGDTIIRVSQIKAMHARLRATNGRHTVIRLLVYVWEDEIAEYVRARGFPVVCCACPGCKDPTLEWHRVKKLLRELERVHPGLKRRSLLGALSRVDLGSLPIPTRPARGATRPVVGADSVLLAAAGLAGAMDRKRSGHE